MREFPGVDHVQMQERFPQGERGVDQGGVVPAALIGTFSYGMLAPWSAMVLVIQESACWVSTR